MDAFMNQMKQSENQYYNQAVPAASVFGSSTFNPYPGNLYTQGTGSLLGSLAENKYHVRYGQCLKHGNVTLNSFNNCMMCVTEQACAKYPEFNLTSFTYMGDKKMAKRVLTTEQKAAITYGRARGLTNIQLVYLYLASKLTPGNIDDLISFAKLLDDYDPSEDDEDDS